MKHRIVGFFPLFFYLLVASPLYGATIGSYSNVNYFTTQQIVGDGDDIAAFAALRAGFALGGFEVTGTFATLFPVSGDIALNGGVIILNTDLFIEGIAEFSSLGNITGNNHIIDVASSILSLPTAAQSCEAIYVTSASEGNAVQTCDWTRDNKFLINGLSSLALNPLVRVYAFNGKTLTLVNTIVASISSLIGQVNTVRCHKSGDLVLVGNGFTLPNATDSHAVVYSINTTTGALTQQSALTFAVGDLSTGVKAASWHPTNANLAAMGVDLASAQVRVYDINTAGIINSTPVATATVSPARAISTESIEWNYDGTFLAVGVAANATNPELLVYSYNQTTSTLSFNASLFIGSTVNALDWCTSDTSLLVVGLAGTASDRLRVYRHNATAGTLTQIISVADAASAINCVDWASNSHCLAVGAASGVGSELRIYDFDNTADTLTLKNGYEYASAINGVRWKRNTQNLAVATAGNAMDVYLSSGALVDIFNENNCLVFSDINMFLNADVTIRDACIIFRGNSTINARNNTLTLAPTCTVIVDHNSSLLMKNLQLNGLNSSKLRCLDNTSTLSLQHATLMQDGTYTFSTGALNLIGDVTVFGDNNTFVYQSAQPLTIGSGVDFMLSDGVTFSFDPSADSIGAAELLQFADNTAMMVLDGATLHATVAGLVLTNGQLHITKNSALESEVIIIPRLGLDDIEIDNGITLGDSLGNDVAVTVEPGVTLSLNSGSLNYKNTRSTSWAMQGVTSIISMAQATSLNLYESLALTRGKILLGNRVVIARAQGKDLVGSINQSGTVFNLSL